jgi:hypothetical protein
MAATCRNFGVEVRGSNDYCDVCAAQFSNTVGGQPPNAEPVKRKKNNRFYPMAFGGLILAGVAFLLYRDYVKLTVWPTAIATVSQTKIAQFSKGRHQEHFEGFVPPQQWSGMHFSVGYGFLPQADLKFTVAGREYSATADVSDESSSLPRAIETARENPVGRVLRIHYNPSRPEEVSYNLLGKPSTYEYPLLGIITGGTIFMLGAAPAKFAQLLGWIINHTFNRRAQARQG